MTSSVPSKWAKFVSNEDGGREQKKPSSETKTKNKKKKQKKINWKSRHIVNRMMYLQSKWDLNTVNNHRCWVVVKPARQSKSYYSKKREKKSSHNKFFDIIQRFTIESNVTVWNEGILTLWVHIHRENYLLCRRSTCMSFPLCRRQQQRILLVVQMTSAST